MKGEDMSYKPLGQVLKEDEELTKTRPVVDLDGGPGIRADTLSERDMSGVKHYAKVHKITVEEALRRMTYRDVDSYFRKAADVAAWENLLRYKWRGACETPEYDNTFFGNLREDVGKYNPEAVEMARDWILDRGKQPGIIFRGDPGNGKSTMAAATLHTWWYRKNVGNLPSTSQMFKVEAKMWVWYQLLEEIKASYGEGRSLNMRELVRGKRAIMIDDLNEEDLTKHSVRQLHELLDTCMGQGTKLLITTNCVLDEGEGSLEQLLGLRTLSRLKSLCDEAWMVGPDYRMMNLENLKKAERDAQGK